MKNMFFSSKEENKGEDEMKKFKDVPENAWYKEAVDYVVEKRIYERC